MRSTKNFLWEGDQKPDPGTPGATRASTHDTLPSAPAKFAVAAATPALATTPSPFASACGDTVYNLWVQRGNYSSGGAGE